MSHRGPAKLLAGSFAPIFTVNLPALKPIKPSGVAQRKSNSGTGQLICREKTSSKRATDPVLVAYLVNPSAREVDFKHIF
jgi:hypothetical protein